MPQIKLEQGCGVAVEPMQPIGPTPPRRRQLRPHLLRQHLPQLHPPLIERVDPPHEPLHRRAMLVRRQQLSHGEGVQTGHEQGAGGTVAGEDLVGAERFGDSLLVQLGEGLAFGQGRGLGEEVGHEFVVVGDGFVFQVDGLLGFAETDEVRGDHPALMHQLVEGVLTVGSRFSKVHLSGGKGHYGAVESDTFSIGFHIHLLNMGRKPLEGLRIGKDGARFVSEKGGVPHPQEPQKDGNVVPQRCVEEVIVHIVRAGEKCLHHLERVLQRERHHSHRGTHRKPPPDPVPEAEDVVRIDPEVRRLVDGRADRAHVFLDHLLSRGLPLHRLDQPVLGGPCVQHGLGRGEGLAHHHHHRLLRIQTVHAREEIHGVHVGQKLEGAPVCGGVGVWIRHERLGHELRSQLGTADTHRQDVAEGLPGGAGSAAGADFADERLDRAQHRVHVLVDLRASRAVTKVVVLR
mmetsp:Transcript_34061/g.78626  ORF Transcript_34061/g.78626 Transcript_34061/m.78626 type:complete len:460 (+) Transcript_34061:222-1601(+)